SFILPGTQSFAQACRSMVKKPDAGARFGSVLEETPSRPAIAISATRPSRGGGSWSFDTSVGGLVFPRPPAARGCGLLMGRVFRQPACASSRINQAAPPHSDDRQPKPFYECALLALAVGRAVLLAKNAVEPFVEFFKLR